MVTLAAKDGLKATARTLRSCDFNSVELSSHRASTEPVSSTVRSNYKHMW